MSYDVRLKDADDKTVEVEAHEEGGTYAIGGQTEAHLNITYNYAWFYYHFLDKEQGIRWLYGKQATDCIKRLETAVAELGTKKHHHQDEEPHRDPDDPSLVKFEGKAFGRQSGGYWCDTPGNAGAALKTLLGWAHQHPEAVFDGD